MKESFYSDITNSRLSSKEFLHLIEKRIRKNLRIERLINVKEEYFILEDESANSEILKFFLRLIFNDRLKISKVKPDSKFEKSKMIINDHLESYINKRLEVFFKNKNIEELRMVIAPLKVVSELEMTNLKKILGINKELKISRNYFVEELQKTYSQTKSSLLKSFDSISERFSDFEK